MMSSTNDEVEVEETLNAETLSMEESNMTRAKVEEVRKENERLKFTLSQMLKDYHSLKMQFNGIATHQEDYQSKKATNLASMAAASDDDNESELVSLSLGRFSGEEKKINGCNASKTLEIGTKLDVGIQLGLNCKLNSDNSAVEVSRNLTSAENSLDESKEEARSSPKNSRIGDDEILQRIPLKKPRVSVRALCNSQTMHDGCQWRKYGQKVAKGNPCPRAYYRCTVSSSCPVRKQVQRCIDDMSILVTTYEGTHDHPLAPSAVAMASATSSAVAMLSCGSSTSSSPPRHGAVSAAAANPSSLFGYNFSSHNYPKATISSSQSHPTVILDLTAPNHTQKFSPSTLFSAATHSSSPSPSLNFSSNFDHIKFPAMNSAAASFSSIQTPAANDLKIAAATKAITHDPNFRSALAAAITSFVGNNNNSNVTGTNSGMDFHLNFAQPSTNNASIGCAASFMNRFPQ